MHLFFFRLVVTYHLIIQKNPSPGGVGRSGRVGGDIMFRTPGMRPDSGGSRVTSEMEEFFALCPCPIFVVTGTDSKITTTSLIADMLPNGMERIWAVTLKRVRITYVLARIYIL